MAEVIWNGQHRSYGKWRKTLRDRSLVLGETLKAEETARVKTLRQEHGKAFGKCKETITSESQLSLV